MKLPPTTKRVIMSSPDWSNANLERETMARLLYYADNVSEIDERLAELDAEWDIERTLETNASALALFGLGLSVAVSRKWLIMPAVIMGFFLQHALQGWCPPLPVLRRLGFRTQSEIELERYALKALRGDFGDIGLYSEDPKAASRVFEMARK